MPDVSIEQARRAKPKVSEVARRHGTVTGVGITKVGNSYAVKVNLRDAPATASLPRDVDGVPVVYEVVGRITAR